MLLVFIEQIVEYFLIEHRNSFEIVAASRFKAHNFIDKSIRLMGKPCNVLLPLHLLADVGRIITDLELDRV